MYLDKPQFQQNFEGTQPKIRRLNEGVSSNYRQLSAEIDYQLKAEKLAKERCYPWQISCNWTPPGLNGMGFGTSPGRRRE